MMEIKTLRIFKIGVLDNALDKIIYYIWNDEGVLEITEDMNKGISFNSQKEALDFYKNHVIPSRLMGLLPLENECTIAHISITSVIENLGILKKE